MRLHCLWLCDDEECLLESHECSSCALHCPKSKSDTLETCPVVPENLLQIASLVCWGLGRLHRRRASGHGPCGTLTVPRSPKRVVPFEVFQGAASVRLYACLLRSRFLRRAAFRRRKEKEKPSFFLSRFRLPDARFTALIFCRSRGGATDGGARRALSAVSDSALARASAPLPRPNW